MADLELIIERHRVGDNLVGPNIPTKNLVPPTEPTPPDDGPDWPRVKYETLYSSNDVSLQATLDKVANLTYPSIVEFPADLLMTKKAWGEDAGAGNACRFHPRIIGLIGKGRGTRTGNEANKTVLGVTPNTAVSKSVCGSAFFTGGSQTTNLYMSDITLAGSDQGKQTEADGRLGVDGKSPKIFTTFFAYNMRGTSFTYRRCLYLGNYANNGGPPGESFAFQHYGGHGAVMEDCEIDGRCMPWDPRYADGLNYGGSITFGTGFGYKLYRVFSHHVNVPAHLVFYQAFESDTYDLRLGDASDGDGYSQFGKYGGAMNHERVGKINHYRANVYSNRRVGDKGVHSNVSQGTYSATHNGRTFSCELDPLVKWYDPTWFDIWGNGQFYTQTWGPKYTITPDDPNTSRSAQYLIRNGVPVTAADKLLKWVYYGKHSLVTSGQHAYDYDTYPASAAQ